MQQRTILLGSAPYVVDWHNRHQDELTPEINLVALNNAWRVCPSRVDMWLFPNDYFCTSPCPPKDDEWLNLRCFRHGMHSAMLQRPFWYTCPNGSGTMILNALYHLLNLQALQIMPRQDIFCVGCDLMYTHRQSHFYGKGTTDPLRFGATWLEEELELFAQRAKHAELQMWTGQDTHKTRLPFPRGTPFLK